MEVGDKPYVRNAADREQVKDAARKAKWTREDELADVRAILATKEGRRFVWRYLTECSVFKTSFTGNSQTFFNEGERNVGLKLMADVNDADPEAYIAMLREAKLKGEKNG